MALSSRPYSFYSFTGNAPKYSVTNGRSFTRIYLAVDEAMLQVALASIAH